MFTFLTFPSITEQVSYCWIESRRTNLKTSESLKLICLECFRVIKVYLLIPSFNLFQCSTCAKVIAAIVTLGCTWDFHMKQDTPSLPMWRMWEHIFLWRITSDDDIVWIEVPYIKPPGWVNVRNQYPNITSVEYVENSFLHSALGWEPECFMHTPDVCVQLLAALDFVSTFTTLKLVNKENILFQWIMG